VTNPVTGEASATSDGPLPRPGLLLFDLDGCLVDSTVPITACMNHALVRVGLPERRPEDLVRFIGPPLPASFVTLLDEGDGDRALVERCVELYRARYTDESLRSTTLIDGIEDALDVLAEVAPIAVVTSKPGVYAEPIIEAVGLRHRFVAVHVPAVDLRSEPKAETLHRALTDLSPAADPATAVMIGDREHDIIAGIACGTRTVGVTWGAGTPEELVAAGADHLVHAPAELIDLLA
jgi:phosphoglycolate phosphatase